MFLLLSTWGLFLLYRHLEKPATVLLVSAAGLVALACLARYTGLAVALAGVSSILLLSRKGLRYRFTDSLVFILVSLLPVAIWLARNALRGVQGTDRLLVYHPLSLAQAKTAVVVFTTWLAPVPLPNEARQWLAIVLFCLLVVGAVLLWKRIKAQHSLRPIAFLTIFILSYIIALGVSLSLFDSSTPVNNRLLSPVFVACLILAACLAGGALTPSSTVQKIAVVLVLLWITSTHLHQATGLIGGWRQQGLGYASQAWAQSGVLRRLGSIASGSLIYSNEPEAIYLQTGRNALPLPGIYNPITRLPNTDFSAEVERMGQNMRDHNAILAIFRTSTWRPYLPTEAEILERLPLTSTQSGNDGTIYTWKDTH